MLFCHENGEPNETRCQDILAMAEDLNKTSSFEFEEDQLRVFGNILECFGNCQYDKQVIQVKEKPKEETREIAELRNRVRVISNKPEENKMVDQTIKLTSYDEFKQC